MSHCATGRDGDKASLSSSGKVCLLIPGYRTSSQALFPNRWWEHLISKSSCGHRRDITGNGLFSEDLEYSSWLHNFKFSFHSVLCRQTLRPSRQRNWGPSAQRWDWSHDHKRIQYWKHYFWLGNNSSTPPPPFLPWLLIPITSECSHFSRMLPSWRKWKQFTWLANDLMCYLSKDHAGENNI